MVESFKRQGIYKVFCVFKDALMVLVSVMQAPKRQHHADTERTTLRSLKVIQYFKVFRKMQSAD